VNFSCNSRGRFACVSAVLSVFLAFAPPMFAQGTQTGIISGSVTSNDGASLPGVAVAATSAALQGERTTVSDVTGTYTLRGLPPGTYKVSFTLAGFATVERTITVPLGGVAVADGALGVASLEETIQVVSEAPSILTTPQVQTNFKYAETVDKLAMNRNLAGIAELAPGLTDNGPNIGQVTIGGAFAYDNVFLLNGVDINDNLFGTANPLFIEDALQEVAVITSGVSAEYGRFSGGVINAVTKSGSNAFAGSWRTDVTNGDWQDESLVEKNAIAAGRGSPHRDDTVFVHTATLGGPVAKDRLWFFGAYRHENGSTANALSVTGVAYNTTVKNRRYEGKLTGRLAANHNLSLDFIKQSNQDGDRASLNTTAAMDLRVLVDRQTPSDLFIARYDGALSANAFVEAQYSKKKFGFRGSGGTDTAITESPFTARGQAGIPSGRHYNAPYFSALDPENRDNNQLAGALSYFLSTQGTGRHDLKLGGEYFTSSRTGGNSQSATGFVFSVDPVVAGGQPVVDSNGRIIPNFVPNVSQVTNWRSVQGAQIDLNTLSLYLNDNWKLTDKWSFTLGVRMERHKSEATQAGIASLSSTAIVPRLAATYDVKGNAEWIVRGTYGHYSGKASETQFADNTSVGNPGSVVYTYQGPAGQGIGFAPAFDLANYRITGGGFPLANVGIVDDLDTPLTKEWTLQLGKRLGQSGEAKIVYANRKTTNFLDDFITIDLGTTTVVDNGRSFGTFDNVLIQNTDDINRREYQALTLESNYRLTSDWAAGASWTYQIKNEGNFEGEAANQPGNYSIIHDRPEFYSAERHFPIGKTDDYQKNKVRIFSVYDLGLGSAGTVSLGGIYRFDSGGFYSLTATSVPITPQQTARNPGYARPPTNQTLFFGARGEGGQFESSHLFDFSLSYEVPIYKSARPFFKAEMRNAFNKQPLIGFDTTITPDASSPRDALGLPTGYVRGTNFGTPLNAQTATGPHVPFPREFRFSLGLRF
jgi:Carboxypeptidase regulatory-like domain/TonB dependent receptor-like, beta-barrel